MRATRKVRIGERDVIVKELTVGEIRAWLVDLGANSEKPIDLVNEVLLEGVSLPDLALMSDLPLSEMDELTESELRELASVAKELNSSFFGLRDRLLQAAKTA